LTGFGATAFTTAVQIGNTTNETFSSRREHDVATRTIDRRACSFDACHCDVEGIKRGGAVVRRIFDGKAGDAGCHTARYVLRETIEIVSQAILEIGIQRHFGRRCELPEMRKYGTAAERAVGIALRMRVT